MGSNFNLFGLNFEGEILIRVVGVSLSHIQFDSARDFVRVSEFKSFHNTIRNFRWYQCSKEEYFLFNEEHVRIDQGCNIIRGGLALHDYLFFEYGLIVIGVDSRNATLTDDLI